MATASQAPNGGFETDCTGIPCNWSPQPGVTLARDTTPGTPHAGNASLRVTTTTTANGAESICITGVAPGTFDAGFWYRTTDTRVTRTRLTVLMYSSSDCATGLLDVREIFPATVRTDGVWDQVTAPVTAPAGTQTARIFLTLDCGTCTGGVTVNYDDVELFRRNTSTGAESICITGVAPGTFDAGFWYRTTDTRVTRTRLTVLMYSSSDCATGLLDVREIFPATVRTDGVWDQVTAPVTAPAGTQTARLALSRDCGLCGGVTVNFDDVALNDGVPTAAAISSFAARITRTAVGLSWRTATEADTLGFNVWRATQPHGAYRKLNRAMIPGSHPAARAVFRYRDPSAQPGKTYFYKLQILSVRGAPQWVGPLRVAVSRAS